MNIGEAADKLLVLVEQTDEEEYTKELAVAHVNQAVSELADENDFNLYRKVTTITLSVPYTYGGQDSDPDGSGYPDYWNDVPGRAPVSEVVGATDAEVAYIKKAWIDLDGSSTPFPQKSFSQLMDKYGDETGVPKQWGIEGNYFYWRPYHAADTDTYPVRLWWQSNHVDVGANGTSRLLTKAPYAVIYRAAQIASVWLFEDNRIPIFVKFSQDALDRFIVIDSMHGDEPTEMDYYNG